MKTKTYYEKVNTKESMPEKEGRYDTDKGRLYFDGKDFICTNYICYAVTDWLKPIELMVSDGLPDDEALLCKIGETFELESNAVKALEILKWMRDLRIEGSDAVEFLMWIAANRFTNETTISENGVNVKWFKQYSTPDNRIYLTPQYLYKQFLKDRK